MKKLMKCQDFHSALIKSVLAKSNALNKRFRFSPIDFSRLLKKDKMQFYQLLD